MIIFWVNFDVFLNELRSYEFQLQFLSQFWLFFNWASFLETAGAVVYIGSTLKPGSANLACPNSWNTLCKYNFLFGNAFLLSLIVQLIMLAFGKKFVNKKSF